MQEFFSAIPAERRPTDQETWSTRAEQTYKYDTPQQAQLKFALNFVLPLELVDDVASQMFANRGIDEQRFCQETYMSEGQLRLLVERGHIVGVHGHSHAPFTRLGARLIDDVSTDVAYLAEATGRTPTWVAYPYGRADAVPDDAVLSSLFQRFNLKIGLTMMGAWNSGGRDPARLARINCNELEAVTATGNAGIVRSAQA